MPASPSASITGAGVLVLLDDHRDVARLERLCRRTSRRWPAGRRCRRPGRRDVRRRSSIGIRFECRCGRTSLGAPPAAGTDRRPARPRAATRRGAPRRRARRSAGHRVRRRAAPPAGARPARRRCASWCRASLPPAVSAALQIGDDVAAAERVDRLLRIADQDQRGAAAERAVDHLPLHGVGVLELVDHHDRPPLMHPQLRRRVVGCERVGQPGEQVVVAQDAEPPLAGVHLGKNIFREADAHRGARVRGRARAAAAPSPGCLTTSRASLSASARLNTGSSRSCPKWRR